MEAELSQYADDDFCYLTTTGRVSGRPHTIEIWFALSDATLYLLAGGRHSSDWVKNLLRTPELSVRLREASYPGRGREVAPGDEDALARRLVLAKYQPRDDGDLTEWGKTALVVAVDF